MKKISMLLAIMFLACNLFAQVTYKKTPEELATLFSDKMLSKLKLTDEQKTKVYDLTLKKIQDVRTIKEQKATDKTKGKPEIAAVKKEYQVQMKAILNPEQMKKYQEIKKNLAEKAKANKAKSKGKTEETVDDTDVLSD